MAERPSAIRQAKSEAPAPAAAPRVGRRKRPMTSELPDLPEEPPRDRKVVQAELRELAARYLVDLEWWKERFPWL